MTAYVYDTEFIEDGNSIDLISIAMINDSTNESVYFVSNEFDETKADDWVKKNVLSSLPPRELWVSRKTIADGIRNFIVEEEREDVELWADYGGYDHVALCQLFGKMTDLPPNIPMYTHEFQQHWVDHGLSSNPLPPAPKNAHNALVDANYLLECLRTVGRYL